MLLNYLLFALLQANASQSLYKTSVVAVVELSNGHVKRYTSKEELERKSHVALTYL
jgi:hypothetical protein